MSRHHGIHAQDVHYIMNEINNISKDEAEHVYGITFNDDGSIFDPTYNQTFISVGEWAEFTVAQDEIEYGEEIRHKHEEAY